MTGGPRSAIRALSAPSLALVAVGGACGAGVRWAVVEASGAAGSFPWWTLLVNVAGCLLLGLLLGAGEPVRLGVGVGFCGGLTTFSTFAVELAALLDAGSVDVAVSYAVVSLVAGVAAVQLGWRLAPAL